MKAVLLIDFGSTYTKITAVDVEKEKILGRRVKKHGVKNPVISGSFSFWQARRRSAER